ncbi:hypothetical protein AFR_17700 [Actinoplanes friuliensis DSM 7358]|uniref:Peptidase S58 DmpA n=1 Tax=Actinoplanes friuliensis DSM 7358 TaxID=1246995 RepID=U5VXV0_9ACTN|nr:hypothetical protein AFR_17700 [Actinoplanes friuliensis DSM 7358]
MTVILPPAGTVGSGEVRGGAPATREFALLDPARLVDRVDAVVLSGGSAFGLSAADGVMGLLRDRGAGFPTPAGPVPIVVGMSIFDGSVRTGPPGAEAGRAAAEAALNSADLGGPAVGGPAVGGAGLRSGRIGAGMGASTGKWRGLLDPGGLGRAQRDVDGVRVEAVVVVNAWGDVLGRDGEPLFGAGEDAAHPGTPFGLDNTTIAVLLTTARLSKADCFLLAQSGHTGFARTIHPAHSRYDGDAVVALATGESEAEADLDLLRAVAVDVMADAIRSAVC